MKIIKPGKIKEWALGVKCSGNGETEGACGALLEVNANDIFRINSFHYDGSTDYCYTIECPQCKTWTDVESRKIPGYIQDDANTCHRNPNSRSRNRIDRSEK